MKTVKPMTLLFAGFVLALGAGVTGGMLLARLPATGAGPQPAVAGSPLAAELGLSPSQAEKMKSIWEGVRDTAQECFDDARRLQKERDDALVSLLNEEQKEKFAKIAKEYADSFAELDRRREAEFKQAVEQTRQVLTAEQWEKYEKILRSRVGPGPLRGMGGDGDAPQPTEPGL